ncbi:unnamed protein product, partial [marine sediment metagenome]
MVEKVEERERAAPAILAGVTGGVTAGGIIAILSWLTAQAKAAPPEGAVVYSPDEWTKEAIMGGLAALGEISGKLSTQIDLLQDIKGAIAAISGAEIPGIVFRLEVTPISETVIPALAPAPLYLADSPLRHTTSAAIVSPGYTIACPSAPITGARPATYASNITSL